MSGQQYAVFISFNCACNFLFIIANKPVTTLLGGSAVMAKVSLTLSVFGLHINWAGFWGVR